MPCSTEGGGTGPGSGATHLLRAVLKCDGQAQRWALPSGSRDNTSGPPDVVKAQCNRRPRARSAAEHVERDEARRRRVGGVGDGSDSVGSVGVGVGGGGGGVGVGGGGVGGGGGGGGSSRSSTVARAVGAGCSGS